MERKSSLMEKERIEKFFKFEERDYTFSKRTVEELVLNKIENIFYEPTMINSNTGEKYLVSLLKRDFVDARYDETSINETYGGEKSYLSETLYKRFKFEEEDDNDYIKFFNKSINNSLVNNPLMYTIMDTNLNANSLNDFDKLNTIADENVFNDDNKEFQNKLFNSEHVFRFANTTDRIRFVNSELMKKILNDCTLAITDIHGNYFLLQSRLKNFELTIETVKRLITEGLEVYLEEEKENFPILCKYIQDKGVEKFNFNDLNHKAVDIDDDEKFYEKFIDLYDKFKLKAKFTFKEHGKIDSGQIRKTMNGFITKFKDEDKEYFILKDSDYFKNKKRIFDSFYGFEINEVNIDNMYDFINEEKVLYCISTDSVVINDKEVNGEFLYELIQNDAINSSIQLFLYYLYAIKNDIKFYNEFKIRQPNKIRTINAPNDHIKNISKDINVILNRSLEKAIARNDLDKVIIGYRKGKNVQDNALIHHENQYVVKADFTKFFDNIKKEDCKNILDFLSNPFGSFRTVKEKHFKRREVESYLDVMDFIYEKTLFNPKTDNGLYMGNPISGTMANLVMVKFIKYINNICKNRDITFTIYADDLTFSIKEKDKKILNKKYVEYIIEHCLKYYGYKVTINPEKTIEMSKQKRRITGIRINDSNEITWDRSKYKLLRAILHNLKHGASFNDITMTKSQLRGKLIYFLYTAECNRRLDINNSENSNNKIRRLITKYKDTIIENGILTGNQVTLIQMENFFDLEELYEEITEEENSDKGGDC